MSTLDIALALAAFAAFVGGYRNGLIIRLFAWVGTVLGLLVVARNLAAIRRVLSVADDVPEALVFGLILGAGAIAGKAFGYVTGRWIRRNLPGRTLARADRWAGAAAGVAGVAALFWVARPLLALVPGWPSEITRDSVIADAFELRLPDPPSVLRNARRGLTAGMAPQITDLLSRSISVGSPPVQNTLDAAIAARVGRSIVRLRSKACGVTSVGAGFVSGNGEITTAAHVVAGGRSVQVVDADGRVRSATVTYLDPALDIARLSANTSGIRRLIPGVARTGDEVAIFGFADGRALRIVSGGVAERFTGRGRDIYDERAVERPLLVLSADLGSDDSGGVIVTRDGRVVGLAISLAPDRDHTVYGIAVDSAPIRPSTPPGRCVLG